MIYFEKVIGVVQKPGQTGNTRHVIEISYQNNRNISEVCRPVPKLESWTTRTRNRDGIVCNVKKTTVRAVRFGPIAILIGVARIPASGGDSKFPAKHSLQGVKTKKDRVDRSNFIMIRHDHIWSGFLPPTLEPIPSFVLQTRSRQLTYYKQTMLTRCCI
jgi:hypothetical protein